MTTTLGQNCLVEVDLLIRQGDDNQFAFKYSTKVDGVTTPVDMTGWTSHLQIRKEVGGDIWLDATDVALGADGSIVVTIDHTVTEAEEWNGYSRGVWGLELTDADGAPLTFATGAVKVSHDVVRDA